MKKLSEEVLNKHEQKRLEYTARQKAIYDYNTLMEENWLRGKAEGKAEGRAEERKSLVEKMRAKGYSENQIAELLNI